MDCVDDLRSASLPILHPSFQVADTGSIWTIYTIWTTDGVGKEAKSNTHMSELYQTRCHRVKWLRAGHSAFPKTYFA